MLLHVCLGLSEAETVEQRRSSISHEKGNPDIYDKNENSSIAINFCPLTISHLALICSWLKNSPFYLLSTLSCMVVLTSLIHPALPFNYLAQFDYLCTCPEYILNAMCRLLKILYRNVEVC